MKSVNVAAIFFAFAFLGSPAAAAENDDEAFGQFQEILQAIDGEVFEPIQKAIDRTDMRNRVISAEQIEADALQVFDQTFWEWMEGGFQYHLLPPGTMVQVKLVDFAFKDGTGKAAIRYSRPNFEFAYKVFDLRHDGRGRLKLVDWFDTDNGQVTSAQIAERLLIQIPTKEAARKAVPVQNPTDLQLFQVVEIFKAAREGAPARFFDIYDDLSDDLKRESTIAKSAAFMAFLLQDTDRLVSALDIFLDVYSGQTDYLLKISDFYLAIGAYEESYLSLKTFQQNFPVNEGALPAKLSALALAIGKPEEAAEFAVEATTDEPSLELGWWSLLRARSSAGDYAGSIPALAQLEDNFGQRLDESKLRRDKFRGFIGLVTSDEYKEWRASRP